MCRVSVEGVSLGGLGSVRSGCGGQCEMDEFTKVSKGNVEHKGRY